MTHDEFIEFLKNALLDCPLAMNRMPIELCLMIISYFPRAIVVDEEDLPKGSSIKCIRLHIISPLQYLSGRIATTFSTLTPRCQCNSLLIEYLRKSAKNWQFYSQLEATGQHICCICGFGISGFNGAFECIDENHDEILNQNNGSTRNNKETEKEKESRKFVCPKCIKGNRDLIFRNNSSWYVGPWKKDLQFKNDSFDWDLGLKTYQRKKVGRSQGHRGGGGRYNRGYYSTTRDQQRDNDYEASKNFNETMFTVSNNTPLWTSEYIQYVYMEFMGQTKAKTNTNDKKKKNKNKNEKKQLISKSKSKSKTTKKNDANDNDDEWDVAIDSNNNTKKRKRDDPSKFVKINLIAIRDGNSGIEMYSLKNTNIRVFAWNFKFEFDKIVFSMFDQCIQHAYGMTQKNASSVKQNKTIEDSISQTSGKRGGGLRTIKKKAQLAAVEKKISQVEYQPTMWFVCHVCENETPINGQDLQKIQDKLKIYIKENEAVLNKYNITIVDSASFFCDVHEGKGVETMLLDMVGSYLSTNPQGATQYYVKHPDYIYY